MGVWDSGWSRRILKSKRRRSTNPATTGCAKAARNCRRAWSSARMARHSIGRRVVAASVLPRRVRGACSDSYSHTCSYTPIRDSRQDSSVRVGVRVRQTRNSTTHTLPRPHTLSACPRRPIAGSGGNYHLNLPSHFGCKVARILLTIQAKFSNITPRHERSQGQRERQAKAGFETGS